MRLMRFHDLYETNDYNYFLETDCEGELIEVGGNMYFSDISTLLQLYDLNGTVRRYTKYNARTSELVFEFNTDDELREKYPEYFI